MGIGGFGMGELIVVFLVVLLLFGAKRLPEIGSSLGKGIREFKGSIKEIEHEIKTADTHKTAPPPPPSETEPRRLSEGGGESQASEGEPKKLSEDA